MTDIRVMEMAIKPPFKFFVLPIGQVCPASKEFCCNSLSKAKEIGEQFYLDTGKRTAIYNVHYIDGNWETRAGWLSDRILSLDSDGTWYKDSDFMIHTAFLWNYDVREWNPKMFNKIKNGFIKGELKYEDKWEFVKKYLELDKNAFYKQFKAACKKVEKKMDEFILAEDELTLLVQKKYQKLEARYAIFDRMIMFYYQNNDGDEKEFQSLEEFENFIKGDAK